jgi:hypothetical protein
MAPGTPVTTSKLTNIRLSTTASMTEETVQSEFINENTEQSRTRVGFPQAPEKPSRFPWKIVIIILVLVLLGAGTWWLFSGKDEVTMTSEVTPTPSTKGAEVAISTPTPEPGVSRDEIKVQVLNGTGVPGGAASLQKELQKIGYSNVEVGNADKSTYTTTEVTFDSSLNNNFKNEIVAKLEGLYSRVSSQDKDLTKYDIQITTGFLKGQSATSTPKPTISSATVTPTLTPTSTPTPTPKGE